MNAFEILETFGVPVSMCIAFGFFIWKQNKWIQEDLKKDMENNTKRQLAENKRVENMSIGLINAQKKLQTDFGKELTRLEGTVRGNYELLQHLTGNGLKKK